MCCRVLQSVFLVFLFGSQANAFQEIISYDKARVVLIDNVTVAALDPGKVVSVNKKNGQAVAEGEILVELNSSIYRADSLAAQLDEQIARIQAENNVDLEFAKKTEAVSTKVLERSSRARDQYEKSISKTEIDRLQLELDQSRLSKKQAEIGMRVSELTAKLRMAQSDAASIRLNNRAITAPLTGLIQEILVQEGAWVNSGQPIARIINLDKVRIQSFFDAEYIRRVNADTEAYFEYREHGSDEMIRIPATVSFTGSEIEVETQDFSVWAEIDNRTRALFPGVKGTLLLVLDPESQSENRD